MSLMRHLRSELIKLELDTVEDPEQAADEQTGLRYLRSLKEAVLAEIVDLFGASGSVGNPAKLLTDLVNRERKASTALGHGVAIPHVRTMQAKGMILAFLKSTPGVSFDAPDGRPVHVFFAMVAPPYEDQEYLRVYRSIGKVFSYPRVAEEMMEAYTEGEIRKILRQYL